MDARDGEDDGHHTGCVDFQREVLALAAGLAVADNAFSILHRYFAGALYQKHCSDGNGEEHHYFNDEHHHAALAGSATGHTGLKFYAQGGEQTSDDTDEDDE